MAPSQLSGLISYGTSLLAIGRDAGNRAGKNPQRANLVDSPIQQPAKFEMAINLKTAKALGLTVPTSLLALADEVMK